MTSISDSAAPDKGMDERIRALVAREHAKHRSRYGEMRVRHVKPTRTPIPRDVRRRGGKDATRGPAQQHVIDYLRAHPEGATRAAIVDSGRFANTTIKQAMQGLIAGDVVVAIDRRQKGVRGRLPSIYKLKEHPGC